MFSEHVKKKPRLVYYKSTEHPAKRLSEAISKSTKKCKIEVATDFLAFL